MGILFNRLGCFPVWVCALVALAPLSKTTVGAVTLKFVEVEADGQGGVDGLDGAIGVAVSPDGKHVYAVGYDDNAVVVFSRNSTNGKMTFVEAHLDGLGSITGLLGANGCTLSPDGKQVYVAGGGDHAVAVFSRDSTTGKLTHIQSVVDGEAGVDGLKGAISIAIPPDGKHVYVTAPFENKLSVFSRNATTGQLTYVEVHTDGQAGVDGLGWAGGITTSADGNYVYIGGVTDNAVAVFGRDSATGMLTFVETQVDGQAGVDGLEGAFGVVISPDDKHLYVASLTENSMAVFSRNPTTGKLTYIEKHTDGQAGVDGLSSARSIAMAPNGAHLVVSAPTDNAVSLFSRNTTTGTLGFVEIQRDGQAGVDGLGSAMQPAFSPDGRHVYVTGESDSKLAAFCFCSDGSRSLELPCECECGLLPSCVGVPTVSDWGLVVTTLLLLCSGTIVIRRFS